MLERVHWISRRQGTGSVHWAIGRQGTGSVHWAFGRQGTGSVHWTFRRQGTGSVHWAIGRERTSGVRPVLHCILDESTPVGILREQKSSVLAPPTTDSDSLAWPDPSRHEKQGKVKRGGVKEEGSGDSEQDVVTSAKITAEPIRLQQSYD